MSRYPEWDRSLAILRQVATKKTAEQISKEAVGGFIREVVNITPPAKGKANASAKAAGEKTILNDLLKIALPVAIAEGKAELASAEDLLSRHAAGRHGNAGRVNPRNGRPLLVEQSVFNRVAVKLQKLVGTLAAGWNAAAKHFGVRLPSWITRHGDKYGSVRVETKSGGVRIIIENDVPFASDVKGLQRRADFALRKQISKMQRAGQAAIRKLARKAGLRVT